MATGEPLFLVINALAAHGCPPKKSGSSWLAKCPAHDDKSPSLSISQGDDDCVLLKCHGGCEVRDIVAALGMELSDLFVKKERGKRKGASTLPVKRRTAEHPCSEPQKQVDTPVVATEQLEPAGLTLEQLAEAKMIDVEFLRSLGCSDLKYQGAPAVRIEYRSEDDQLTATRYRVGLHAEPRFRWKAGAKVGLYGLDRLRAIRAAGWVLIVEGESDCWTAWKHGVPAIGVPGKATWKPAWAEHFAGVDVYVWQEPDAEDFTRRISCDLPNARVIVAPEGVKDISDALIDGRDVAALLDSLKATAGPAIDPVWAAEEDKLLELQAEAERRALRVAEEARQRARKAAEEARILELQVAAAPVMGCADPLELVRRAIVEMGFGGDPRAPMTVYLAATSRLLAMRRGAMPVHCLLIGPPSAGKSYAVQTALALVPEDSVCVIDAGSPRALIYSDDELSHRVLVFGEADSLPSGEDNPAASAVRNLLQDHHLHYEVTEGDSAGGFTTRHIVKEGPTVMVTTAIKRLGEQLTSRLFVMETKDTQDQTRAALVTQARLELHGAAAPDAALIAYQDILQGSAPWEVTVPFVGELAAAIGRSPSASRVLRDFARLVSLIKSVAIIRHRHRERDERGQLVATVADYQAVLDVVGDLFEASVTGASLAVREAVQAVDRLMCDGRDCVNVTALAEELGLSKQAASARAKRAIAGGWLRNRQEKRGRAYEIVMGDPLPDACGLPTPESLASCSVAVPSLFRGKQAPEQDCSAVPCQTDSETGYELSWDDVIGAEGCRR